MAKKEHLVIPVLLSAFAAALAGCASVPHSIGPPASSENLAKVDEIDFGREPTEYEVAGPITNTFASKVMPHTIVFVSTRIDGYQRPPYHKCLLQSSRGSNRWYAGYCIGFHYDWANRPGTGSHGQGWVHIDESGALTASVWPNDNHYEGGASQRTGNITEATDVRILDHRGLVDLPLKTYSFNAGTP